MLTRAIRPMFLLILAGAGFDGRAHAQCLALKVHGSTGDRLGAAVDIKRPLAMAGAPGSAPDGGAYEILLDHRWERGDLLKPRPSTESGDSLCMGDSQVFIAATTGSLGRGHIDVFEASGSDWVQGQRLTASNGQSGELFGFSMTQAGPRLIVGAPQWDAFPNDNRGRVLLFENEEGRWVERHGLVPESYASGDYLGRSVAASQDWVMSGAWGADDGFVRDCGTVHFFHKVGDAWLNVQTVFASDRNSGDRFGWSIHLDGMRLLVGAPKSDAGAFDGGCVYVFEFDGVRWVETARLIAPSPQSGGEFGYAVVLEGDRALIGAPYEDAGALDSGCAYLFERNEHGAWNAVSRLAPPAPQRGGRFGASLALEHPLGVIGAPGESHDNQSIGGAVYAFYLQPDCNGNGVPDDQDLGNGFSSDCNRNCILDECEIAENLATDCDDSGFPDGCESEDCNDNGVIDLCDVRYGGFADCNADGRPDVCETARDSIDLVVIVDTEIAYAEHVQACFTLLPGLAEELETESRKPVRLTALTIDHSGNTLCGDGTVTDLQRNVPGNPGECGPTLGDPRSWAQAVSIVAEHFAWRDRALRVVVPVVEQGPCKGDPCGPDLADCDAARNAIRQCRENGVYAFQVTTVGVTGCGKHYAVGLGIRTSADCKNCFEYGWTVVREELIEDLAVLVNKDRCTRVSRPKYPYDCSDCGLIQDIKTRCKAQSDLFRITTQLKTGLPGGHYFTMTLDGGDACEAVTNDRGTARCRWTTDAPGPHEIRVLTCPGLRRVVTCGE